MQSFSSGDPSLKTRRDIILVPYIIDRENGVAITAFPSQGDVCVPCSSLCTGQEDGVVAHASEDII